MAVVFLSFSVKIVAFMGLIRLKNFFKWLHGDFQVAQKSNHATLKEHLGRAAKFTAPSNFLKL